MTTTPETTSHATLTSNPERVQFIADSIVEFLESPQFAEESFLDVYVALTGLADFIKTETGLEVVDE